LTGFVPPSPPPIFLKTFFFPFDEIFHCCNICFDWLRGCTRFLHSIKHFTALRRYAFVMFRNIDSAIRAQAACANSPPVLNDRRLIVHFGSYPNNTPLICSLLIIFPVLILLDVLLHYVVILHVCMHDLQTGQHVDEVGSAHEAPGSGFDTGAGVSVGVAQPVSDTVITQAPNSQPLQPRGAPLRAELPAVASAMASAPPSVAPSPMSSPSLPLSSSSASSELSSLAEFAIPGLSVPSPVYFSSVESNAIFGPYQRSAPVAESNLVLSSDDATTALARSLPSIFLELSGIFQPAMT
jgi:hypothetical protein